MSLCMVDFDRFVGHGLEDKGNEEPSIRELRRIQREPFDLIMTVMLFV